MSEHTSTEIRKRSSRPIRIEGARSRALEMARNRLLVTGAVFALSFLSVAVRLVDLTVFDRPADSRAIAEASRPAADRGDIVDRNGILLATSLPTASLFADPEEVIDPESAADKLVAVFPELHRDRLVAKLSGKGRFVWIRRESDTGRAICREPPRHSRR